MADPSRDPPRAGAPAGARETDAALVQRVRDGDASAFEGLMRAHNRRLFRIVRGVVADDAESEDVCQEAWLLAYTRLPGLNDPSVFGGWLGRIGFRCALARRNQARDLDALDRTDAMASRLEAPERRLERARIAQLLERAIDRLAPSYRAVVLLRDVEQASTSETAEILGLSEDNVRVRLHRARARLREDLADDVAASVSDVFRFENARCDRLVASVMSHVRAGLSRH